MLADKLLAEELLGLVPERRLRGLSRAGSADTAEADPLLGSGLVANEDGVGADDLGHGRFLTLAVGGLGNVVLVNTEAGALCLLLGGPERGHVIAQHGRMEIIAAGEAFLQQELGDVAARVEDGGHELCLGACADDLDLDGALEQPLLDKRLGLAPVLLCRLCLALCGSLRRRCPDAGEQRHDLPVLLLGKQQTDQQSVSAYHALDDSVHRLALPFLHEFRTTQVILHLDDAARSGVEALVFALGLGLEAPQLLQSLDNVLGVVLPARVLSDLEPAGFYQSVGELGSVLENSASVFPTRAGDGIFDSSEQG